MLKNFSSTSCDVRDDYFNGIQKIAILLRVRDSFFLSFRNSCFSSKIKKKIFEKKCQRERKKKRKKLEDDGVNSTRSAQELNILDNELHVPVTRARRRGDSIDSTSFLSLGGHPRSFPTCLRGS